MKQKIFNALKTEYSNLGLSDKALNGVASFLEKTITDENGIAAAIKEAYVSDLLKTYQSELDSERGKASKAQKDLDDYRKLHPAQEPPKQKEEDSEMMKLLKQMQEDNKSLRERFDKQEQDAKRAATIASVRKALKDANCGVEPILDLIFKGCEIADTDTVDTLTEKYKAEYQTQYKAFYGDGSVPPIGGEHHEGGYKKGKFAGVISSLQDSGVLDKPSE